MERVQFQQEQMLLELKDLVDKNLFTEKETKQIMKKRTTFETTLVRRVAKKADFLRYITYEMGLEQLRRKRVARLNLPPAPQTVSDYALVRRQFHIFERALKRFKSDVGLWIQYIQLAKREGARALVGRITARALQLHPNQAGLYIIAASHELDHLSPSAARTLLQRGIRMNPESIDIWREYVRMELGFIESLRRRWDVLGISLMGTAQSKGKDPVDPSEHIQIGGGSSERFGSEGDGQEEEDAGVPTPFSRGRREDDETEFGGLDGDEGAAARRQIMQGGIVKSVMTSAAEALPQIGLFLELKRLIAEYPSPGELRKTLFDHLYELVRSTLPDDAQAARLLADRHTLAELKGAKLVDGVQSANEELFAKAKARGQEEIYRAYTDFIEDWCHKTIDQHLKVYLISSLQALIQQCSEGSPSLLSAHIRLLMKLVDGDGSDPEKVIDTARKYTTKVPKSSQVWLARLEVEKAFRAGGSEGRRSVESVWREARCSVTGKEEEVSKVWIWGLGDEEGELVGDKIKTHKMLLKESMGYGWLRGVHERVLMSYVTVMHEAMVEEVTSDQASRLSAKWLDEVRRIGRRYLTTDRVWQNMFRVIGETDAWREGKEEVLGAVYREWREKDRVSAVVEWGLWLVKHGKGGEASAMVACATRALEEDERLQVEKRWGEALDCARN